MRSSASRRRAASWRCEQLLERAEHQREGSAELVAHVAEEGGLGAVELGQGLGAAALVLVGFGFGDGGGDLGGGELEEGAVGVVQLFTGADAGYQEAGGLGLAGGDEGEHERGFAERGPRAAGDAELGQSADLLDARGGGGASQEPGVTGEGDGFGADGRAGLDTDGGGELGVGAVFGVEVKGGEGDVVGIVGESPGGGAAGFSGGLGDAAPAGEVAQGAEAALADDTAGGLGDGREDADDGAGVVANRTIGKGEVTLLGVAVALEEEEQVVGTGGVAAVEHAAEHGADDVPDFGPALTAGAAEGGGMLAGDDFPVSIVVEHDELGAPPDQNGEARVEAGGERDAEGLRPRGRGAERGRGPIHRAHERAHLAATVEAAGQRLELQGLPRHVSSPL